MQLRGIELLVSTISDSVPIYTLAGNSSSPLEASTATRLEMGSVALQGMSAASASNPGIQIPALEEGALDRLLLLLNASHPSEQSDADAVNSDASTSAANSNSNPNPNSGLKSNSTSASEQREMRHQVANVASSRTRSGGSWNSLLDLLHRTRLKARCETHRTLLPWNHAAADASRDEDEWPASV